MVVIRIQNLGRVNNFQLDLLKKTEQEVMRVTEEFVRFVQKSAKLRARMGRPTSQGDLAESIIVKKGRKQIIIVVTSPYAIFQEKGFKPHWIHSDMDTRTGRRVGDIFGREGFFYVRRHRPFIAPALETGLNRLPTMLKRGVEKAVIRAKT